MTVSNSTTSESFYLPPSPTFSSTSADFTSTCHTSSPWPSETSNSSLMRPFPFLSSFFAFCSSSASSHPSSTPIRFSSLSSAAQMSDPSSQAIDSLSSRFSPSRSLTCPSISFTPEPSISARRVTSIDPSSRCSRSRDIAPNDASNEYGRSKRDMSGHSPIGNSGNDTRGVMRSDGISKSGGCITSANDLSVVRPECGKCFGGCSFCAFCGGIRRLRERGSRHPTSSCCEQLCHHMDCCVTRFPTGSRNEMHYTGPVTCHNTAQQSSVNCLIPSSSSPSVTSEHSRSDSGRRNSDGRVTLNVGGKIYVTTEQTLMKYRECGHYFSRRLSKNWTTSEKQREIFIDRNGKRFAFILDFLRDGKLHCPSVKVELEALLDEAEFFCFEPMVQEIKRRIRDIDREDSESMNLQRLVSVDSPPSHSACIPCVTQRRRSYVSDGLSPRSQITAAQFAHLSLSSSAVSEIIFKPSSSSSITSMVASSPIVSASAGSVSVPDTFCSSFTGYSCASPNPLCSLFPQSDSDACIDFYGGASSSLNAYSRHHTPDCKWDRRHSSVNGCNGTGNEFRSPLYVSGATCVSLTKTHTPSRRLSFTRSPFRSFDGDADTSFEQRRCDLINDDPSPPSTPPPPGYDFGERVLDTDDDF